MNIDVTFWLLTTHPTSFPRQSFSSPSFFFVSLDPWQNRMEYYSTYRCQIKECLICHHCSWYHKKKTKFFYFQSNPMLFPCSISCPYVTSFASSSSVLHVLQSLLSSSLYPLFLVCVIPNTNMKTEYKQHPFTPLFPPPHPLNIPDFHFVWQIFSFFSFSINFPCLASINWVAYFVLKCSCCLLLAGSGVA